MQVNSTVYFSNKQMKVYSKRNLTNFQKNINLLDGLMCMLDTAEKGTTSTDIKKAILELKGDNSTSDYLSHLASKTSWKAKQCHENLSDLKTEAIATYQRIMRTDFMNHTGYKRGIPFLGDAISFLTDIPSPNEWAQEKELVRNLKSLTQGEMKEVHLLQSIVSDEETKVNEAIDKVNYYHTQTQNLATASWILAAITNDYFRIDILCDEAMRLANAIRKESRQLIEIEKDAELNRANELLFPLEIIDKKLANITNKEDTPLFNNVRDVTEIYHMANTVTFIEDDMIHSLLTLPLVDFTFGYEFIDQPHFDLKNIERIHKIEKIALKKIDIFLCSNVQKNIRIFSTKDLQKCLTSFNKKITVCNSRSIVSYTAKSANQCSSHNLAGTIAIELSETAVLIDTEERDILLKCNGATETINTNETVFVIHLKQSCKVTGSQFEIGPFMTESKSTPIKTEIKEFKFDKNEEDPSFVNQLLINGSWIAKTNHNTFMDLKVVDEQNEILEKDLETVNSNPNVALSISVGVTASLFGGIIIFYGVKIYLKKRKQKRTKNRNEIELESEGSNEHDELNED